MTCLHVIVESFPNQGVAYGMKFRNFSIRKLHVTTMTSISSLERLALDLPPACIAFCPTEPKYFVIGTYHLHRKENQASEHSGEDASASPSSQTEQQKRSGTLELFRLQGEHVYASCITVPPAVVNGTDIVRKASTSQQNPHQTIPFLIYSGHRIMQPRSPS